MERRSFGFTRDKQPVDILTLDNGQLRCSVLTYGAALAALSVPAADGSRIDVALGFDSMEDYQTPVSFPRTFPPYRWHKDGHGPP